VSGVPPIGFQLAPRAQALAAGGPSGVEGPSPPRVLIPDAGVGVAWYVPQPYTAEALRLLGGAYELHVPDYFFTEAASTLQQYVALRNLLDEAEGLEVYRRLRRVPMTIDPTSDLLEDAYHLGVRYRRPVYDSLYLALAQATGGQVVTADARLYRGAANGPLGGLVRWVTDPL
jgi:predicted nucleic acid-binding protein